MIADRGKGSVNGFSIAVFRYERFCLFLIYNTRSGPFFLRPVFYVTQTINDRCLLAGGQVKRQTVGGHRIPAVGHGISRRIG
jgi:hypothetical protein